MLANKAYVIGLTGGIGCGKSEAAKYLASLGALHLDADQVSRSLTAENGEALPEIRRVFGDGVFNDDGTLDRKSMAEIVFNDPSARRNLEGIIHPLVQRSMLRQMDEAARQGIKVIILDVPLLFETGMDTLCDECWTMYTDRETQIERIMERDNATREHAQARIDSQMSSEERNARAARVIDSSKSIERTRSELGSLYNGVLKKLEKLAEAEN